jgi:isopenicillin N synthase-like dioxygenase
MADMKSTVRSLLDRPIDIKRRNKSDDLNFCGYVEQHVTNSMYESLGLHDVGSQQAVHQFCDQLNASPQQRETILMYSKTIHELAMDVGHKLNLSMGFTKNSCLGWTCQFRINKFHFTPQSVGLIGASTHTDPGFLTILQDGEDVGGLEIFDKNSGMFMGIDPWPGTLVVNLGDIAKAWSNGRFCNIQHRVRCMEGATRMSIALFMLGPEDTELGAPAELVDNEHPRLYKPFIFDDYRKLRVSTRSNVGQALERYRINTKS